MERTRDLIDFTKVKKTRFSNNNENTNSFKNENKEVVHVINEELENTQRIEYENNLKRLIKFANPVILKKETKKSIPPPELEKVKPYTIWVNFNDFLNVINRPDKVVFDYFKNELREEMNLLGDNKIRFRRDVDGHKLQEIIKKYVKKYVRCSLCGSWNTESVKVNNLNSLKCLDCNSTKAIAD